jgi:hypothetical protein
MRPAPLDHQELLRAPVDPVVGILTVLLELRERSKSLSS